MNAAAKARAEGWDEAEYPPEPTWEMVGLAHREIERLTRRGTTMQVWGLPFFGRRLGRGSARG
ncbi:hypothetical protein F8M49_22375 [Rhodococcus zopfii]|uniref:Uncharacterized protein n=1 Tax=Rhodococcus zopfii TaxID=43772 RepID=A0ABU3WTS8_9NOCA|nr:hypothetical protein [Rhodococcus zopfii]MDV2477400.1 hypothetical protein [Rhodococcus zopfii]MDV2477450.1 hypothetical protein [Rhodococcus zopfii]